MKDLGDYVYLIFIALAIVSSFFGKKKKREDSKPADNPAPSTNWQDILQQMTGEKETDDAKPTPLKVAPLTKDVLVSKAPISRMNSETEGLRSVVHKESDLSLEEDDQSPFFVDFEDEDDLKRAIIYSEIFNRR